jgi:hypothetical protein
MFDRMMCQMGDMIMNYQERIFVFRRKIISLLLAVSMLGGLVTPGSGFASADDIPDETADISTATEFAQEGAESGEPEPPFEESETPAGDQMQTVVASDEPVGDQAQTAVASDEPAVDQAQTAEASYEPVGDQAQTVEASYEPAGGQPQTVEASYEPAGDQPQTVGELNEPAGNQPQTVGETEEPAGDQAQTVEASEEAVGDQAQTVEASEEAVGDQAQTVEASEKPAGDQAQTAEASEEPAGDQAQTVGETEEPAGDQAQTVGETEEPAGDQAQTVETSEVPAGDQTQTAEETNEPAGDQEQTVEASEEPAGDQVQTAEASEEQAGDQVQTKESEAPAVDQAQTVEASEESVPVENNTSAEEMILAGETASAEETASGTQKAMTQIEAGFTAAQAVPVNQKAEQASPEDENGPESVSAETEENSGKQAADPETAEIDPAEPKPVLTDGAIIPGKSLSVRMVTAPDDEKTNSAADEISEEKPVSAAEENPVDEPAKLLTLSAQPMLSGTMNSTFSAAAAPEENVSYLQKKIDEALASVSGKLTEKISLVLERSTTYEGDVVISIKDREQDPDKFVLEISTEDCGENGDEGDGKTQIIGNIEIRGIKVIMNSVIVSPDKKISVKNRWDSTKEDYQSQGGELILTGSKKFPNEMSILVGQNSSATVKTSDDDDIITVETTAGAKNVNVDTGEGINTVNATLNGGNINIKTGPLSDTLRLNVTGNLEQLHVQTLDGMDDVSLMLNGSTPNKPIQKAPATEAGEGTGEAETIPRDILIDTGDGDDNVAIDVRSATGTAVVNTGSGSDTVSVTKGDHYNLDSVDYDQYTSEVEKEDANLASGSVLTLKGSDRGDRITVDASTALAIKEVRILGSNENQGASVYLKGTLAEIDNPITYVDPNDHSKGFVLHTNLDSEGKSPFYDAQNDYTLTISGTKGNNYTDTLKNKKTVKVEAGESGDFTYNQAKDDFTNYVLTSKSANLGNITVTGSDRKLLLSNFVMDAEETQDDGDTITINEGKTLRADNLNVLLLGEEINIKGTVKAQNVRAESAQGTVKLLGNISDIGEQAFGDTMANLFSAKDSAVINVSGTIEAAEDVALVARVKHAGGMVTFMPDEVNLVNVKVADAQININDNAKIIAQKGNVSAESRIKTTIGYSYDELTHQENPIGEGMFLAVTVIVNNAAVTVAEGASISSGASTTLHSESTVKSATYANSSEILPSPVDVALTVISNQVHTRVDGKITAGEKVQISAIGSVTEETVATGSSAKGGLSGAYVAVSVVDQDVGAVVGSKARIKAGADLQVITRTYGYVTTKAVSGKMKPEDAESMSVDKALKHIVETILKQLYDKFTEGKAKDALGQMMEAVGKSSYSVKTIKYSESNEEKGSATVSTESVKENNITVVKATVKTEPKQGYKVKQVRYRYLKPGENHYTFGEAESKGNGEYTFNVQGTDTEVWVIYEEGNSGNNNQNSQNRENADVHAQDLVNDAAEMGHDSETADTLVDDEEEEEEVRTWALKFGSMTHGAVVTWRTEDDKNLAKVKEGDQVRLVPNPAAGYTLKEDSLTITYEIEENGKTVTKKDIVTADAQGRYIFKVPKDLTKGTLTVKAEFIPDDGQENGEQSHNQATGALAVGILNNDSSSLIEKGANVDAGGSVVMFGFKMNRNTTLADGTAVDTSSGSTKKTEKKSTVMKDRWGVGGAEFALRMNSNVDGKVTGSVTLKDKDANNGNSGDAGSLAASAYHPKFAIAEADVTNLDKVVLSYYGKVDTDIFKGRGTRNSLTLTNLKVTNGEVTYDLDNSSTAVTQEITAKLENGKIIIQVNLTGLGVKQGTTVDVDFMFNENASDESSGTDGNPPAGTQQYLITNPIKISYNMQKEQGDETPKEMGTVTFDRKENGEYAFRVEPHTNKGYTIDDWDASDETRKKSNINTLYASWIGADGKVKKAALYKKDGFNSADNVWWFKPTTGGQGIPDGAVITINAVFREDTREIKTDDAFDAAEAHGDVEINTARAKCGDTVEVVLKPEKGYAASALQVTYFDRIAARTKTLDVPVGEDGKATFEMPNTSDAEGSYVKVTPTFAQKTVQLCRTDAGSGIVFNGDKDDDFTYENANVTVTPSAKKVEEGYKVTKLTVRYTDADGKEKEETVDGNVLKIEGKYLEKLSTLFIDADMVRKD